MKKEESTLFDIIEKELDLVEQELTKEYSGNDYSTEEIASYLLRKKGKRIRPALLLLSYLASKEERNNSTPTFIIQLAAMVETIHNASMIHDDIIDNSTVRRGQKALHLKFGNKMSILIGDFLYAKSSAIISSYGNLEILNVISSAVVKMCKAEIIELFKDSKIITEEEYLHIISEKTASLFSASCECGAIIANTKRDKRTALQEYGLKIGLAFQIVDDIFDVASNIKLLGKPISQDIKNGKFTLPLIYTLKKATRAERKVILDNMNNGHDTNLHNNLVEILNKYKAIDYSYNYAANYSEMAKNLINKLPSSLAKQTMLNTADFVVSRNC